LVTDGSSLYSYMFINQNGALASFSAAASPTSTSYPLTPGYILSPSGPSGSTYTNPRIEAPQYISISSSVTSIPVWEQYENPAAAQSMIFWNVPD
jgi:hypothetical protein